ncbi:MAG: diguanylate cyclase [Longimicrobiales bacterium]
MPGPESSIRRPIPKRAMVATAVAFALPVLGVLLLPTELLERHGSLVLLPIAFPPFVFGFYRGYRGTLIALAASILIGSLTLIITAALLKPLPEVSSGIAIGYLGLILGIGWLTEMLHRDRREAEGLAFTDLLTHLPNRRHARFFMENEFAAARRGRTLSVVLFDLDHFKVYNDRWGHVAGDGALKTFAEILVQNTRRMNLSGRFGGEEFVSVLAGSDGEGALAFAERVRNALRNTQLDRGSLTVSAGVATFHPSMKSPDELLAAADHALYRAKGEGRDCVAVFGRSILQATLEPDSGPGVGDGGGARPDVKEYPRATSDIGKTSPPLSLLPSQLTRFGEGRRILVVEDEEGVRVLLQKYLEQEGCHVEIAPDVPTGIGLLTEEFDVVISDIRLPGQSGTELIAAAKSRWPDTEVIAVTGINDAGVAAEALTAGADGYLFKPFEIASLRNEIVEALERRDTHKVSRSNTAPQTEEERRRAEQAREILVEGARSLVRAIEIRDLYAGGHAERVAAISGAIARNLGPAGYRIDMEGLQLGCELHDVGKVGIPAPLLNKAGPLEPDERLEIQRHPVIGRTLLSPLLGNETILAVVGWHHERWDGSGYPDGLMGETIPLAARIAAIADVLDALTRPRSYRGAQEFSTAAAYLMREFGTIFDPSLEEPFRAAADELESIVSEHPATAGTAG